MQPPWAALGESTPAASSHLLPFLNFAEEPASPAIDWLWQGILAPGYVTLLTSQWKSGKSTLLSVLLAKMRAGGPLAGLPVRQGKAMVLSEETEDLWRLRHRNLDLRPHHLMCRPYDNVPDRVEWCAMLDNLTLLQRQQRFDLLVLDTIIRFLPCYAENSAVAIAQCLAELRQLAGRNLSVLLNHHPRKGDSKEGQAARGSGALGSQVDIVLEMYPVTSLTSGDRRRWLHGFSRFEATPRQLLLELNAAASDYAALPAEAAASGNDLMLLSLLRAAPLPPSLRELLASWPDDHPRPDIHTLRRRLERLADGGFVLKHGTGRKNDACRYALVTSALPE